jgi:hypothetical protein
VAEYLELNRANWDDRVPAHVASADYAVQRFLDDPAFLSDAVRFDLPLLGDVSGLHGVHLQCHIGTDTISLARLGASMTGLDFSGADASFVQADLYDAAGLLRPGSFDLVCTGVGALTWLPDIRRCCTPSTSATTACSWSPTLITRPPTPGSATTPAPTCGPT